MAGADRNAPAPGTRFSRWWRRVRHPFRRFAAYSGTERILLLSSAIDLPRIHHWLVRDGYNAAYARTQRPHRLGKYIRGMPPEEVSRIVDAAARRTIGFDKSCLRRALLLVWLLRSAGVQCDLVSGMGKDEKGWKGHSWVEVDGVPLREAADVNQVYGNFRDQLSRRDGAGANGTNPRN